MDSSHQKSVEIDGFILSVPREDGRVTAFTLTPLTASNSCLERLDEAIEQSGIEQCFDRAAEGACGMHVAFNAPPGMTHRQAQLTLQAMLHKSGVMRNAFIGGIIHPRVLGAHRARIH